MAEWMPVLMAQAWQVTLLIVVVAAINRWAGKSRPHLAHALWLVVLMKCVTPPIWSSPSGLFCWLQPAREAIREPLAVAIPSRSWSELLAETRELETVDVISRSRRRESSDDAETDAASTELSRVRRPPVAEVPSSIIANQVEWPSVLLGAWALASLAVIGVAVVRWLSCWRMLRNAPQRECSELSEQLDCLAKSLKLRRRVRLIVTESRLGPAVIGLFRTTVLLPALIVDRLAQRSPVAPRQESRTSFDSNSSRGFEDQPHDKISVAEQQSYDLALAPILAHELLHIRRGDLWVGLLQTLAQAVWWCHPLVWWVNRRTTREAERCCDEEVLAELGCDPAAYARALVDVLELKRELKPVPVFPGVRPVEVTSQRLERIMQLGQGCQRRTPWWCWLIAPLAIGPDGAIDLDKEPKLGLAYRVRVISGAEDDLRTVAQKLNDKLIEKPGAPVVVEHDELLRLLKDAQAFPRLNLMSHPVATGRGRKSVTIADTATFAFPVEVTAADGTTTLLEQSREHGWRLTMQPRSVGIESLRLNVVNELSRLNNDAAVKVRFRTTGEEKLIPGLDVQRTNTTVELKHAQHVVFPITKVPNADSQDVMLVMMQACLVVLDDALQQPEPTPMNVRGPAIRRGVGVNSNTGVTGEIVAGPRPASPPPHPAPEVYVPHVLSSEQQILLTFKFYEVSEDVLKGLRLKPDRTKSIPANRHSKSLVQVHTDQAVIAKLTAMEREKRIPVLSNPSITTIDGRSAGYSSVGEFFDPTVVDVGGPTRTGTPLRGFGLHITAKPTVIHPSVLSVSMTLSGSSLGLGNEDKLDTQPGLPMLMSQAIQLDLMMTPNEPLFFGPIGEPNEKGARLIATLSATIVEPKTDATKGNGPGNVARPPVQRGDLDTLKAQPASAVLKAEKLITVDWENVPLKDAIKQLAKSAGRNIVLESSGLEDESLTERVPITLSVDDVKLSSALKLMLDPLNLGYRIEESDVIVVTSQQRLKGQPIVVTYSVADLSVPIPKRVVVKLAVDRSMAGDQSKPSDTAKSMPLQIHDLVDLITSTCQPNSWEEVGGNGRIKANDSTLSLVVRQTRDVHEEIRDLLGQMRRLQQTEVALQIETWTVANDFWERLREIDVDLQDFPLPDRKSPAEVLAFQGFPTDRFLLPVPNPPADAPLLRLAVLLRKEAKLLGSVCQTKLSPKVTLFNGQELELIDGLDSPPMRLILKPVLFDELKRLRLHAAVMKPGDVEPDAKPDFTKCAVVLDAGNSILLDVFPQKVSVVEEKSTTLSLNGITTQSLGKRNVNAAHRTLLLITGTVLVAEEEESLLGIPD